MPIIVAFYIIFLCFSGNDYEDHTKCITEEERYSGKGFVAKAKKGEQKQNTWVEMVQSVLNEQRNAPRNVIRIIETVSKHTNTPRKKPKFINFVKNVCGHKTNLSDIEAAWGLISVKLSELSQNNKQNNVNGSNDSSETNNGSQENNNGSIDDASKDEKQSNGQGSDHEKKGKSKKEKKEEKKRQKYEAELQSAAVASEDTVDESTLTKKEKKLKGKIEHVNDNTQDDTVEGKSKNKKRKRKDTVTETLSIDSTEVLNNIENVVTNGVKQIKKKIKADEVDISLSLHDQNVASGEEVVTASTFDWHTTIISVLKKKGNELQFKKLQKKVLGEYSEATGINVDDRIADKFIKKLKSAPNVKVDKNRVVLEE